MDILKILSRGTKQPPKKNGIPVSTTNIPSANLPNPQLFHDAVGQKRKREDVSAGTTTDVDLGELDFFAPRGHAKAEKAAEPEKAPMTRLAAQPTEPKLLDEDECRQLLRSHRLKLTILSTPREKTSKVKKGKKKKASVKVEAEKEKTQVYPQPLTAFTELRHTYGISPRLAENLEKSLYQIPTEVQMASLPLLLKPEVALRHAKDSAGLAAIAAGAHFIAVAPTGSGKTLSFLIPAINSIMRKRAQEEGGREHELNAVVVVPTRELANQITDEGRRLAVGTGVRVVAMKKGMRVMAADAEGGSGSEYESEDDGSDSDQEDLDEPEPASATLTKADILVTTPLLLLNYLSKGSSKRRKELTTVRSLVLDEADVLLDPLFREQTLGIWTACTNPELQMTFWSATMGSNIESLVGEQIDARAEAASTSPRALVRLVVGLKDTAVPNVRHKLIYTATEAGKLLALRQLLHPAGSPSSPDDAPLRPPFLVFTQTADRAAALHDELRYDIPLSAGGAARVAVLHAGLPDAARAAVVARFRAGSVWVLVATDVLARGVDFAGVNAVVNYDVPASAAAYVHRAGRTGRAGRGGGVAVTLYTRDDIPFVRTSVANVVAASERQAGRAASDGQPGLQPWLLDALPRVAKHDRQRLKRRGVEARRSGAGPASKITSKSGWERRRENNRRGAVEGSKRRKLREREGGEGGGDGGEWGGFED